MVLETARGDQRFLRNEVAGTFTLALGGDDTNALGEGVHHYDLDLYDPLTPDDAEPLDQGVLVIRDRVGV